MILFVVALVFLVLVSRVNHMVSERVVRSLFTLEGSVTGDSGQPVGVRVNTIRYPENLRVGAPLVVLVAGVFVIWVPISLDEAWEAGKIRQVVAYYLSPVFLLLAVTAWVMSLRRVHFTSRVLVDQRFVFWQNRYFLKDVHTFTEVDDGRQLHIVFDEGRVLKILGLMEGSEHLKTIEFFR